MSVLQILSYHKREEKIMYMMLIRYQFLEKKIETEKLFYFDNVSKL
jgi:hypothetical protein